MVCFGVQEASTDLDYVWLQSLWPPNDRVRPSKQTCKPTNLPMSYMELPFHLWMQKLAMTDLMFPSGNRRSLMSKGERGCTVPLLVALVLGKSDPGVSNSERYQQ